MPTWLTTTFAIIILVVVIGVIAWNVYGIVKTIKQHKAVKDNQDGVTNDHDYL